MSEALHSASASAAADEALAELIAEITDRLHAGESVDIAEYAARCPGREDELRRLLTALEGLDSLKSSPEPGRDEVAGADTGPPESSRTLGDFRIVRELGHGGMGVVYEAEQLSLGRRVALKVLPLAAVMDPRHLQRFQNEARAAASLHHEHIVPVYAVGSERGVHYYAMQLIDGQTLAEFLQRQRGGGAAARPAEPTTDYGPAAAPSADTAPQALATTVQAPGDATYFRRVAEWGVQAAEALEHAHQLGIVHRDIKPGNLMLDARGKLWGTDFGLARLGADTGLTRTGDLVGTLRYMSPEQALAKRVVIDHRTDLYSLGVTLYELLAGEPAVRGQTREEILRQIIFAEPKPPRHRNKAVPRDLETIVLKAMAQEPERRYVTALELADDLRRWLEDRPIQARRPPLRKRLARWGRRHKPLVTGVIAALLMGFAVLAGSVGWVARDRAGRRAEIQRGIDAALEESLSWQRQGRMPEALSSARRAVGLLAGADLDEALQQQVRARLHDLEWLDKLENVRLDPSTVGWEATDERYRQTFREAGLDVEALPAGEIRERLRRSTVVIDVAAVLDHWGAIRRRIGGADDPKAKHLLRAACALDRDISRTRLRQAMASRDRQALLKIAASDEVFRLPPATLGILGLVLAEDKVAVANAEALLREAQRRHPGDFNLNYNLSVFFATQQPPQAEEARRFATAVVALRPGNPAAHARFGAALLGTGQLDEAITALREAIRLKKDYAEAHCNLGNALLKKGRLDDAIAAYRQAIRLKENFPEAHSNLGAALMDKGQLDEAITAFGEALRLKKDYAEAHHNLGNVLQVKGQLDDAITAYRRAIHLKEDYPEAHYNLGNALVHKGQLDKAAAAYREAIRLKKDFAGAHCNLGNALLMKGRLDEAISEYRQALRLKEDCPEAHHNLGNALIGKGELDKAAAAYREAIRLKKDDAEAHCSLGGVLLRQGRVDHAVAEYRQAIRLKKDFAGAHNSLGNALRVKGRLDEATVAHREALRIKKDYAEAHCDLGGVLEQKGLFAEALVHRRRGHELGSRNPRWPYPSAQWVRNCERLVELDNKLPAILSGQEQPADAAERLGMAFVCQLKKRYAAALRLYTEAFAEQPERADDLNAQHRYNAACAAALAGCGQGKDADKLDAKERARLRQQALEWLREDLKTYRRDLDRSAGKAGPVVVQRMRHWLQDADFAGVRGPEALGTLPEAERAEWGRLWEEVEAVRQQAAAPLRTDVLARPKN